MKKKSRKYMISFLITGTVMLLSVALLLAGNFANQIRYESRLTSTFFITDDQDISRGTGTFEILTEGPICAQRPLTVSWIKFYWPSSNQRIERVEMYVKPEQGSGNLLVNIPKEFWNQTWPPTLNLLNGSIQPTASPFYFNGEGIVNIKVNCVVNVSGDPSYQFQPFYISFNQSSDILISSHSNYEAYLERQIQAAGLVFGFAMVSIPVAFNTFWQLYEKISKWRNDIEK
ncbi:MAG: hypothetical protein HZB92_03380 [Euryarchaeota archaeon]|nr:hypothetical protein [Euryarchaeota archaeon]